MQQFETYTEYSDYEDPEVKINPSQKKKQEELYKQFLREKKEPEDENPENMEEKPKMRYKIKNKPKELGSAKKQRSTDKNEESDKTFKNFRSKTENKPEKTASF